MKATEQYFHVVLFIMLYKVVLTFKSVDEPVVLTIKMKAVLLSGAVYYAVQGGCNLYGLEETLVCDHSKNSLWCCFCCTLFKLTISGNEKRLRNRRH